MMLLWSLKTNAIQTNIALKHHLYHLNLIKSRQTGTVFEANVSIVLLFNVGTISGLAENINILF